MYHESRKNAYITIFEQKRASNQMLCESEPIFPYVSICNLMSSHGQHLKRQEYNKGCKVTSEKVGTESNFIVGKLELSRQISSIPFTYPDFCSIVLTGEEILEFRENMRSSWDLFQYMLLA